MTAVEALKALQAFVSEKVAQTILLQKEGLATSEPEMVHPYVSLITLPHKNFMPVNFQVPHILIGFTNGTDGATDHPLSIRMQFATYGGDVVFKETANIPDSSGYIDLLNLMERTKSELVKATIINGCGVVNKPIMYGVYDEQLTYPIWYGYLTFDLQIQMTNSQITDFL